MEIIVGWQPYVTTANIYYGTFEHKVHSGLLHNQLEPYGLDRKEFTKGFFTVSRLKFDCQGQREWVTSCTAILNI
jgi:hypothetical protein